MKVDLFSLLPKSSIEPAKTKKEKGFSLFNVVFDALKGVNSLENNADKLTQKLVSGKLENIHDLMIASEKAEVALNFIMAIRNHALRAYQEIMGLGR